MTSRPTSNSGPLAGVKVLELSSELGAWAGRLMAGLGAEVLLVEPPGGDRMRTYEPFLDDQPGPERSLWFWHYNASKRGAVLDLDAPEDQERFRRLAATADVVIECEKPGRLAALHLDYPDLSSANPGLIMASITPFGRSDPRGMEAVTDLTLLAGGGVVWMCGYDDHSLPPVRGGGNQGYQTASHFAVQSILVALLYRDVHGRGQHIDVNAHAACNVTTEAGSYDWLVANRIVQRQTGRHAAAVPTMPALVQCADGRWVNGGIPARTPEQFRILYEWLGAEGLLEKFDETAVIEWAMEGTEPLQYDATDDETRSKLGAARSAANFLAANLSAFDYFSGGQARGFQLAIVYSPDEALEDRHIKARGFQVPVEHEDLGRTFIYPGAPIRFVGSPMRPPSRAPHLGEHQGDVGG